jgi:microcystin-dependent protein
MAFPTTLDSIADVTDGVDYPEATHINTLNDAVEAIEEKIGIDSSAVSTSLDYKIKNTTGGHDHDGSDSKKVLTTNLDVTGLTVSELVRTNSAGTALESSGKTVPTGDIVGTSDSQTLTTKTLTSPVINTGVSGTAFLDEDNMASNSATKFCSQQSIKAYVDAATTTASSAWPVGSVYINALVSTNPATLLGFGTWTAIGAGKMIVGYNASDTDFDSISDTGGSKTATIAEANLPSHSHTYSGTSSGQSATHNHTSTTYNDTDDGTGIRGAQAAGAIGTWTSGNASADHTHTYSGTSSAVGSGTALSVMNPYIVCYLWKRTA